MGVEGDARLRKPLMQSRDGLNLTFAAQHALFELEVLKPVTHLGRLGRRTWAEHWKLQNALVLFNPAPVT